MKKVFLTLVVIFLTASNVFAAKIPDGVKSVVKKDFAQADFRFDGLITLPDGTLYLPLYPALVKKPDKLEIKSTVPQGKNFKDKPDIVIFNNDFALLKIITDQKGRKTVLFQKEPPIEIKTGLLPQDLLVPTGLVIPDNIKGIVGNLQISTAQDAGLKIAPEPFLGNKVEKTTFKATKDLVSKVAQLQNKTLYIATCYAKDIQVIQGESTYPQYALEQKSIPVDIKATPDEKFLLVTNYGKNFVNVISLADEKIIKQLDLTAQGGEIVIDKVNNKAYVASPSDSMIYIIDLNTMTFKQKIKVKGMCQKLTLSDDGTKLFYTDRKTNDIWVVELNNGFIIKDIGTFPNISKIVFTKEKIYVTSRTKNRLVIIDYATLGVIKEVDVEEKPVDMLVYKNNLFVLSAQNNIVQVFDTNKDELAATIDLNTKGFSTKIYKLSNSNIAIVTDTKTNKYSVMDLDKKQVIKTTPFSIPVSQIVVVPTVKKINR